MTQFALVTRRPHCPGEPKKLCFTTLSLIPMVSIARLSVVKQSSFVLPGQHGRRLTKVNGFALQAPVVQTMDSAVHRINYYPADKHLQNQLSYPVDSDLSRG